MAEISYDSHTFSPTFSDPKLYKKYPNTEHIHFYGFYIGNFPDLSLDDVDFICDVLNSA